jgi:hypothetical protein
VCAEVQAEPVHLLRVGGGRVPGGGGAGRHCPAHPPSGPLTGTVATKNPFFTSIIKIFCSHNNFALCCFNPWNIRKFIMLETVFAAFQVNPDPVRIQDFDDQKLKKKEQLKIFLNLFFDQKLKFSNP